MRVVIALLFGIAVGVAAAVWTVATSEPPVQVCPIRINGHKGIWLT